MKTDLLTLAKDGANNLLNMIYPPVCAVCQNKIGADTRLLAVCAACLQKVKANPAPYCEKCGRSLRNLAQGLKVCSECAGRDFYYQRAWAGFIYEGVIKEALHLLKYSKRFSLINTFGRLLAGFLRDNPQIINGVDAVAAVPLHHVRFRERGFNQAAALAGAVVREFGVADLSPCLRRKIATRPQSELDKNQRGANVRGTFEVISPQAARGENILIVDDLFTTGATLNECARVLKKCGAAGISCLAFARGE